MDFDRFSDHSNSPPTVSLREYLETTLSSKVDLESDSSASIPSQARSVSSDSFERRARGRRRKQRTRKRRCDCRESNPLLGVDPLSLMRYMPVYYYSPETVGNANYNQNSSIQGETPRRTCGHNSVFQRLKNVFTSIQRKFTGNKGRKSGTAQLDTNNSAHPFISQTNSWNSTARSENQSTPSTDPAPSTGPSNPPIQARGPSKKPSPPAAPRYQSRLVSALRSQPRLRGRTPVPRTSTVKPTPRTSASTVRPKPGTGDPPSAPRGPSDAPTASSRPASVPSATTKEELANQVKSADAGHLCNLPFAAVPLHGHSSNQNPCGLPYAFLPLPGHEGKTPTNDTRAPCGLPYAIVPLSNQSKDGSACGSPFGVFPLTGQVQAPLHTPKPYPSFVMSTGHSGPHEKRRPIGHRCLRPRDICHTDSESTASSSADSCMNEFLQDVEKRLVQKLQLQEAFMKELDAQQADVVNDEGCVRCPPQPRGRCVWQGRALPGQRGRQPLLGLERKLAKMREQVEEMSRTCSQRRRQDK